MTYKHAVLALAGLLASLAAAPSLASPIQWTLTDVLFEDGGTAAGSFVFDADTDTYSAIAITTTAGSLLPGAGYSSLVFGGDGDAALVAAAAPDLTGASLLQLIYQIPLTNAGGIVLLVDPFFPAGASFEGRCLDAGCTSVDPAGRLMVDGGVIGTAVVPLPGAAWLLTAALGVAGRFGRRRRGGEGGIRTPEGR